jgi:MFS family permease
MRIIVSLAALLTSVCLMQLASGALGPLDALSGLAYKFTTTQTGLLGSAHFFGFLIGCWLAPRIMGNVGHVRAFASFTSLAAISCLAHPLFVGPFYWALLRILSGLSIAGVYTVIEAWINAKVDNSNRATVVGVYRFIDISATVFAQLIIGVLSPASFASYNILALLYCACLFPLILTTSIPPLITRPPRLNVFRAIKLSPLAAVGVLVAGFAMPVFRMVGPIYGSKVGLSQDEIGFYLAMGFLGGALVQIPIGYLADRFDRRWILIFLSFAASVVSLLTVLNPYLNPWSFYVLSFTFGMTTMPIFSISSALANDFSPDDFYVDLAAALMFIYAISAIISPYLASLIIENFGPSAMFFMIALVHIVLISFGFFRMRQRKAPQTKTPYLYLPRTTFTFARILKKKWLGKK